MKRSYDTLDQSLQGRVIIVTVIVGRVGGREWAGEERRLAEWTACLVLVWLSTCQSDKALSVNVFAEVFVLHDASLNNKQQGSGTPEVFLMWFTTTSDFSESHILALSLIQYWWQSLSTSWYIWKYKSDKVSRTVAVGCRFHFDISLPVLHLYLSCRRDRTFRQKRSFLFGVDCGSIIG